VANPFRRDRTVERAHYEINVPMSDPRFAEIVAGIDGTSSVAGLHVNERTALHSTAVYRAVSILANTIAGLPLKSYRTDDTGQRVQIDSLLDDPAKKWYTPFEWCQIVMTHLVLHGNSYLLHVYNNAGGLQALFPIHPTMVHVTWKRDADGQAYRNYALTWNTMGADGNATTKIDYTSADITHIMGMSLDGLRGVSPLRAGRAAIGAGLAGDVAATGFFENGLQIGATASIPGITPQQAKDIARDVNSSMTGGVNAGKVAVINAAMTISPWSVDAEAGQFIESRQFQVEEVARLFGIPKVLLAQDGASTWGSGISELDKGMAKYTFTGYTRAIEERLSDLLYGSSRHVEFDYSGLFRGTPEEEAAQLATQVEAGLLTINEARAIMNLPPIGEEHTDPQVQQAIALVTAAPTLVKDPGLPALVDQLRQLAGIVPLNPNPISPKSAPVEPAQPDAQPPLGASPSPAATTEGA
jgi:HK97 family phage portal protein